MHALARFVMASFLLAGIAFRGWADAPREAKAKDFHIEVCFVLDTTGSMGGLIEGAKTKIWSIANEILNQKPRPKIKIALVAYRDRGDDYITKHFDLTEDIDTVFKNLQAFQAGGGGDGPESVNQALNEAVHKVSWSRDRDVLKVVFLVGDAPPHMDYADDVKYQQTCQEAVKRDLVINTVQCGGEGETTKVWQEVARLGEGSFLQLGQTGDMVAIATPHDAELAKLSGELNGTVVAWGDHARQRDIADKLRATDGAAPTVAAARTSYMGKASADEGGKVMAGGGRVVGGEGDLVADAQRKDFDWTTVKKEQLPEAFQKMSPEELKRYVAEQQTRREALQKQVTELAEKRDQFIKAERERLAKDKKADAFDTKVAEILEDQAKRKR